MTVNAVLGALDGVTSPVQVKSDQDTLFLAFVGRNQDVYLRALEKIRGKDPSLRKGVITWCWPAFLITVPWLFYRKLYGHAAVLIGFLLVVSLLFPSLSGHGTLSLYVLIGMFAKLLYVQHALKRIDKLRTRAASKEELDALVSRAGGVSIPGAVVGTILFVGFNILAFITAFAEP